MADDILIAENTVSLPASTGTHTSPEFLTRNQLALISFSTSENTDIQNTNALVKFGDDGVNPVAQMFFPHSGNYMVVLPSAQCRIVFTNYGSGDVVLKYAVYALNKWGA